MKRCVKTDQIVGRIMRKLLFCTLCVSALVWSTFSISSTSAIAESGSKETIAMFLGAALGGWGGSQIGKGRGQLAATGAGVLVGALIGRNLGLSLDRVDQIYATRNRHHSLEYSKSGDRSGWRNPDTGNYGNTTPLNIFRGERNQYCREYQTEVIIGGHHHASYGTACRRSDGSWELVNNGSTHLMEKQSK